MSSLRTNSYSNRAGGSFAPEAKLLAEPFASVGTGDPFRLAADAQGRRPIVGAGGAANIGAAAQGQAGESDRNVPLDMISDAYRSARNSENNEALRVKGVNGWGYVPRPGDQELLARAIFAESAQTPADMEAHAYAILNRVRPRAGPDSARPENAATLRDVIYTPGHFPFLPGQGRNGPDGNDPWASSAHPEQMNPQDRRTWNMAQRIAAQALSGKFSDPTHGALLYFSSDDYDGSAQSAPGDFKRMLRGVDLIASEYRSPYPRRPGNRGPVRPTYFFRHRADDVVKP